MKVLILTMAIAFSGCSLATVNTYETHKRKCTEDEAAAVVDFALMVAALGLRLHYNHENKIEEGSRFDPFAATRILVANGAFYSAALVTGGSGIYGVYHAGNCQSKLARR